MSEQPQTIPPEDLAAIEACPPEKRRTFIVIVDKDEGRKWAMSGPFLDGARRDARFLYADRNSRIYKQKGETWCPVKL